MYKFKYYCRDRVIMDSIEYLVEYSKFQIPKIRAKILAEFLLLLPVNSHATMQTAFKYVYQLY